MRPSLASWVSNTRDESELLGALTSLASCLGCGQASVKAQLDRADDPGSVSFKLSPINVEVWRVTDGDGRGDVSWSAATED